MIPVWSRLRRRLEELLPAALCVELPEDAHPELVLALVQDRGTWYPEVCYTDRGGQQRQRLASMRPLQCAEEGAQVLVRGRGALWEAYVVRPIVYDLADA